MREPTANPMPYWTREQVDERLAAERERIAKFIADELMRRGIWGFDNAELMRRVREGDYR